MEEIYQNSNSPQIEEFKKLLNTEFKKNIADEGKIVTGTISKKTEKVVWVTIPGAKSEGVIELSELRLLKEDDVKVGDEISIVIERLEDKEGNIVISREKAKKLKSWKILQKCFQDGKEVEGQIISKIKGGFVIDISGSMAFLPGSQVDLKPLKSVDHLMKTPQKFLIVRCDDTRGNIVVSRRAILENKRNETKDEILSKYKVGDTVDGICKGLTAYGVFFDIDGFDCMSHINELSHSRVSHPDELFSVGQKQKLKIIDINNETKQISVSVKALTVDPFETNINSFKTGSKYKATVMKIMDYGIFLNLSDSGGLEGLCHSSEYSHSKKNISGKKLFSIGQEIEVVVKEIQLEARRISLSYKAGFPNPWDEIQKTHPSGSTQKIKIKNITEFAIFATIENTEIDCMMHYKDIDFTESEEALKKFKKEEVLEVKILEINSDKEQVRVGRKQLLPDPLQDYFKDKKKRDIITVTVREILDSGIKVEPEGCNLNFLIKKNQIAVEKADQRVNRFTKGDRLSTMIAEINLDKRNVQLSIKLLEEAENKLAIKKYGSTTSGKSLPFADLPSALKEKKEKKKK